MKMRRFDYNSGKKVWIIDPCNIIESPYSAPFHEHNGHSMTTSFTVDESLGETLAKNLSFQKEVSPGKFVYYWAELSANSIDDLIKLAKI